MSRWTFTREVFPAQAGIYLHRIARIIHLRRLPRTGGDLPLYARVRGEHLASSPHRRGSTSIEGKNAESLAVFPAQAGIYQDQMYDEETETGLPRTGGDLPHPTATHRIEIRSSPHRRGSTREHRIGDAGQRVFPAQAGIYPPLLPSSRPCSSLPRTGGDLPCPTNLDAKLTPSSPHRRGSTLIDYRSYCQEPVFPAQAGIYLTGIIWPCWAICLPRTGGDLPPLPSMPL